MGSGAILLDPNGSRRLVTFSSIRWLCVALILLGALTSEQVRPSVWLDGAIVSLGAAAVCTAFALGTIVATLGGTASVALGLTYSIGDIVLFAVALGVVVMVPRCRHAPALRRRLLR